MKDAKGHGSDGRGGGPNSPEVAKHMKLALANAAKFGPDHESVGKAMHDAIMAARPAGGFYKMPGTEHQQTLAAQHGVTTEHLSSSTHNSHGHEWGSPAALADFKTEHGGPANKGQLARIDRFRKAVGRG